MGELRSQANRLKQLIEEALIAAEKYLPSE
jgi:hypothetical protein